MLLLDLNTTDDAVTVPGTVIAAQTIPAVYTRHLWEWTQAEGIDPYTDITAGVRHTYGRNPFRIKEGPLPPIADVEERHWSDGRTLGWSIEVHPFGAEKYVLRIYDRGEVLRLNWNRGNGRESLIAKVLDEFGDKPTRVEQIAAVARRFADALKTAHNNFAVAVQAAHAAGRTLGSLERDVLGVGRARWYQLLKQPVEGYQHDPVYEEVLTLFGSRPLMLASSAVTCLSSITDLTRRQRDAEVRRALDNGDNVETIATHAGLHPSRIYQIRDGRR